MFAPLHEAPFAYLLVVVTLVCSLRALSNRAFFESCCMHPYSIYRGRRPYTIFTSIVVHGNPWHLVFTLPLIAIGMPEVEWMLMDDFGAWKSMLLMLSAASFIAVLAGLLSVLQYRNQELNWSCGGSALFYGIAMLYLLYNPIEPLSGLPAFAVAWLPGSIAIMLFLVLVLLVVFKDSAGPIHLYGAMAGILFTFMIRPQAIAEMKMLLSGQACLEERDDKATRNDQTTDHANQHTIEDSALAAFTAGDCFSNVSLHALHPPRDYQTGWMMLFDVHSIMFLIAPPIGSKTNFAIKNN